MFGKDHLLFTLVVVAVHFARALSFSFASKQEVHDDAIENNGVFAKAGRWFNKLKQKNEKEYESDTAPKLGGVLPTQLRSSEVKRSKKHWLSMDQTAPIAPKNAQTVSHSVSDIASGQMDAYGNTLEQSYIQDSAQNMLSVAGKSDLSNLNALLRGKNALNDQKDENMEANRATMSFKIEITPRAAEITVSIGPANPVTITEYSVELVANAVENGSDTETDSDIKKDDDSVQSMEDVLPQHSSENKDIDNTIEDTSTAVMDFSLLTEDNTEQPVPSLFYDNNNNRHIAGNIYTTPNSTVSASPLGNNISPTTTALDLSYIALFCFILGVLCTYLLNKLVNSIVTWYKGRIPRYIAGLEKQAIRLLSEHKYAEVKTLLTTHLPCIEGYKGARHTDVAAFRHFLGKALLALGEHRAACQELSRVVSIYESYGEDLYMAHALEDLALAQQELPITKGKSKITTGNTSTAIALTTMQRALRIFTEEALAQQALAAHPLSATETLEDLEGVLDQDYISSPTDTTCDDSGGDDNDTSIEYSICTDTTIDAFNDEDVIAIRKSTVGDDLENTDWDQDVLSEDVQNSSSSSSNNNSVFYDTLLAHSLDSQDPHSPIYRTVEAEKNKQSDNYSIQEQSTVYESVSPAVKQKNVLFESTASPVRTALSPVKLSMKNKKAGVEKNSALASVTIEPSTVAGAAVGATNNDANSMKETSIVGENKDKPGNGGKKSGSPNENAHPNNKKGNSPKRLNHSNNNNNSNNNNSNNKTRDTTVVHVTPQAKSGRKHKNNATSTTTHPATPNYSTTFNGMHATEESQTGGDVSFTTALADLERLLAEPATSPSALIGPYTPHTPSTPYTTAIDSDYGVLKTRTTHYTESVLDYSPYSVDYHYHAKNTSHNSEMDSYSAAYAQFNSDVKPTSNPLHAEMHTSLVVEELNALLLHSPDGKKCTKYGFFDTIECVEDLHVARVLHRVATLLKKLNRYEESTAFLAAARSVYVALQGESSEVVSRIDEELALTAHAAC
eukprot:gene13269-15286_t